MIFFSGGVHIDYYFSVAATAGNLDRTSQNHKINNGPGIYGAFLMEVNKMQTFMYKETRYPNRTRNNRGLTIYRIKNNTPVYIGCLEYSTGSTRGAKHEVFNYLMDNGYIPKKHYKSSQCDWMGPGYFFGEVEKHYNIIEI